MKKRIPIVIVVLAIAGAAVYAFRNGKQQPDNRLMVSGNIELNEGASPSRPRGASSSARWTKATT